MTVPRPLSLDTDVPPARRVTAAGSRFEIGRSHGESQRAAIRAFLDDRTARLGAVLGRATTLEDVAGSIEAHAAVAEAHLPAIAEEVAGLAEGAGIDRREAWLLQLRRELTGYRSVRARAGGDCTTFGRLIPAGPGPEGAVIGQTVDLNGDMAPELTVLDLTPRDTGRRVLMASFTGLLGYLGMNDRGLAVGLSLVLAGQWRPGIPGYMAIRHLLDAASTVDEALDALAALPLASSRALTITDGRRLVTVEHVLDERVVLEGDCQVHTNHFLHDGFAERDELNPFALTSSRRRFDACAAMLRDLPVHAGAEAYLARMAEPPIDVSAPDDIRREWTVATAILRPDRGEMTLRRGHAMADRAVETTPAAAGA
ncbi:MAG: C45 family peptidase [Azospirillaceae bacterium]